jgi:hypothetical protein
MEQHALTVKLDITSKVEFVLLSAVTVQTILCILDFASLALLGII